MPLDLVVQSEQLNVTVAPEPAVTIIVGGSPGADGAPGPAGPAGATGATGAAGSAGPSNTITTTDPATLTSLTWPDGTVLARAGTNFKGITPHDSTLKGSPTATDEVWIYDAASGSLKRATLSSLGTAVGAGGITTTGNPYIDVQYSANVVTADSDTFTVNPFTIGSPVWTMWNQTDNTAMSLVAGSPDPWSNTLTGTQFKAEVLGSCLFVQVPLNKVCLMMRTISTGSGTYVLRTVRNMSVMNWGSGVGPLRVFLLLASKLGNFYDTNNFVWSGVLTDVPGYQRRNVLGGSTTNDNATSTTGANLSDPDTFQIRVDGTVGNIAHSIDSAKGAIFGTANRSGVFSPNLVTIYMLAGTTSGTPAAVQSIFGFDYMIRLPATKFAWG